MSVPLMSKVFAVTGGASGMGAATCRLLAKNGAAAVCVGDWNTTNFTTMEEELKAINPSTQVLTTKLDVSQSSSVNSWISEIIAKFGRLDGAANVAGVPQVSGARKSPTILEETDEAWRRTMSVNIDGIFYCTRAEVKAMVELPKRRRAIVNVASLASMMHTPDTYAYGASKRACASFSSSVAKDVLPFGIRVNTVSPGATNTPMMPQFFPEGNAEAATQNLGMNMLDPSDIARAVVYLLSDESEHIAGVNLPVGSGAP
ncbi:Chanoclavine-I dehydrogenase easD [Lachnellula cervina]|uniref:Chanoclavine-I dehydrogenase easD n=1 Tax=Lachnellula cervina TaxID=1316786 RepID=A0A7D8UQG9_9HELO|nr:Chanoclavine-I dehydrogenase easD [Lachnellula cervina]